MSRSSSATAAQDPPPLRQKSCGECQKAKRRCDRNLPACVRCIQRHLNCCYPTCQLAPQDFTGIHLSQSYGLDTIPSATHILADQIFPDLLFSGTETVNELIPLERDDATQYHDVESLLGLTSPSPSTLVPATKNAPEDLWAKAAPQLNYAIVALKTALSSVVDQNQTSWLHPHLYQAHMPRSMEDAHAVCALYLAKNEMNSGMVFRFIDHRAKELRESPEAVMPAEILARVHALLLYQIIRLFDGDIRQRGQAEAAIPELESCNYSLRTLCDREDIFSTFTIHRPPMTTAPSWESWIFLESARRTFLFTFVLLNLYKFLRGDGGCEKQALPVSQNWTLSAHLWEAQSAFDFGLAWREKKHFEIETFDFTEVLRDGGPNDFEAYGKLFLVLSLGLDEAKGWFHTRGGVL